MKKFIGFTALFIGIADLFFLMYLMFTENVISDGGFTSIGMFSFALWFVCIFTAIICFISSLLSKAGKPYVNQNFVQNVNTVFCKSCGKAHIPSVYCPHCGAKQ